MKNEQQIRQWAKSHTVHINDVHAIMGYLTAIEAEIENDITFNTGAKKECFDSFVEWFEKDSKILIITPSKQFQNKLLGYMSNGTQIWQQMQPMIDKIEFKHIPDNNNVKPKFKGVEPDYTLLLRLESEKETETHKGVIDAFVKELENTRKEYDNTLYGSIQDFNGSVAEALNETATGMFKLVNDLNKNGGLFSKETVSEPNNKYKVGDWVRTKDGKLLSISLLGIGINNSIEYAHFYEIPTVIPISNLEPAIPKEGEFWYFKLKVGFEKEISFMEAEEEHSYCLNGIELCNHFDKYVMSYWDYRPATEAEKNQLIKAVKDKYNKTWNGKEWVDMYKKGDYVMQNKAVRIYLDICSHINSMGEICKDSNIVERYASPLESRCFDISLKSIGKRFNPETLELEDILKVGDMVIAWYGDFKMCAVVGILDDIRADNDSPYWVGGDWRKNAIKYISEQQYRDFLKGK